MGLLSAYYDKQISDGEMGEKGKQNGSHTVEGDRKENSER